MKTGVEYIPEADAVIDWDKFNLEMKEAEAAHPLKVDELLAIQSRLNETEKVIHRQMLLSANIDPELLK